MSAKTQVKATSEPLNKGFIQVVERFIGEGWKLVEDTKTQIVFVNPKNIYDEFKMQVHENRVEVVIPMPNEPPIPVRVIILELLRPLCQWKSPSTEPALFALK